MKTCQVLTPIFLLLLALLVGCTFQAEQDITPGSRPLRLELVDELDQANCPEPSGIAYHTQRGTLFVVGDEGDICEIQTDGALVEHARVRGADLEGITVHPDTGLLYAVIEGEEKIVELEPERLQVLREFAVDGAFEGKTLLEPGGEGLEAITFVPDVEHPGGGTFFLTNQSMEPSAEEDASIVLEVELPLGNIQTGKIVGYFSPDEVDLSGLHYDETSQHLYIISDTSDALLVVTLEGEVMNFAVLPGKDQEGITVDEEGFFYIAQDSGGILKLTLR